jgi:hypothetical protein
MNLIGLEIVNVEEGELRIIECRCSKGKVELTGAVQASFAKPFTRINSKELKSFFKENGIGYGGILLIIPAEMYRYSLWAEEVNAAKAAVTEKEALDMLKAYVDANRTELNISEADDVRTSFSGSAEACCHGIITMIPHTVLDDIFEVFRSFNLKYALPSVTAYSLLNYDKREGYTGIFDLKETSLALAVYHAGIMIWLSDMEYNHSDDAEESGAADVELEAVYAAA